MPCPDFWTSWQRIIFCLLTTKFNWWNSSRFLIRIFSTLTNLSCRQVCRWFYYGIVPNLLATEFHRWLFVPQFRRRRPGTEDFACRRRNNCWYFLNFSYYFTSHIAKNKSSFLSTCCRLSTNDCFTSGSKSLVSHDVWRFFHLHFS